VQNLLLSTHCANRIFENSARGWNSQGARIVSLLPWAYEAIQIGANEQIFRKYLAFSSNLVIFAPRYSRLLAKESFFNLSNTPLQRQKKRKKEREKGTLERAKPLNYYRDSTKVQRAHRHRKQRNSLSFFKQKQPGQELTSSNDLLV
jgi:hypothetical protein